MKQTVGILAYGSLISGPGSEIKEILTSTECVDETPFPVEFARRSGINKKKGRGGAPTLVPYPDGGKVRAQVFVVDASVNEATNRLYRREIGAVGSGKCYEHTQNPKPDTVVIDWLEGHFSLDVVLYVRLCANICKPTAAKLAQYAIESVAKADSGKDGISYLMNAADAGTKTPLTADYAEEVMLRTDTHCLADALKKVKAMAS